MADIEQLKRMRRRAHEAGDTDAARRFTARIKAFNQSEATPEPVEEQAHLGHKIGAAIDGMAQGLTFGYSDEIAAGLDSGFGLLGDYDKSLAEERARMAENKRLAGGYELGGQLTGVITSGTGLAKLGLLASARLAPHATLGQRVKAGSLDGLVGGLLYGSGTGEDLKSRLKNAAIGGSFGASLGGVLPVAGSVIRTATQPVRSALTARLNPEQFQSKKILERFQADGVPLDQAQRRMKDGLNLADVSGEAGRNLLRTTTNMPGKAQSRVASRLAIRQMQQGDRLKESLSKTFADPDGYLTVKDRIAAKAQEIAKPLYDEAYANPVPFSRSLEAILTTPAGKEALRKATAIAGNEQKPFVQWFANVADDGTVSIKRVPDMRAWDYIKRGFDDVIEGQTDSITGKVTNAGRAVVGLKNRMLKELDQVNPAYAEARKTWSGFAKMDEALEYGKSALNKSPEEVRRVLNNMSEAEIQSARIGMAEALRGKIDKAGFTHNAILKIFGNRQDVARLRAMFKSNSDFQAFRRTIIQEAKKQKTFNAVRGNSTTARQLMDMYEASGINNDAVGAATDLASGRVGAFVQRLGGWLSRIGGMTPEVADGISQKLLATNPASVKQLFKSLDRFEKAQIAGERKSALIRDAINRVITTQTVQIAN